MRRLMITGLRFSVATLVLVALMTGCGWFGAANVMDVDVDQMPLDQWNTVLSVTFSELSVAARASASVADAASSSVTYEYNSIQIGSADVGSVQGKYEEIGTYLGSFTPQTFKIKGLTLGFGRSDSDAGFTVFSGQEPMDEYFDLMDPVYASKQVSWEPGHYDVIQLMIPMDVSEYTVIEVEIPGYTDEHIYAYQSEVSESDGHLWGTPDDIELIRYLGSGRFQLHRLYSTARQPVGTYVDEFGDEMGTVFPTQTIVFRKNIEQSTVYSDMADSVTDQSYLQGNTHLSNVSWGTWADVPFDGFTIGEQTTELRITFNFDTTDIFQLWQMTDAFLEAGGGGLSARYRVLLAPDFYERITVRVDQE